LSNGPGAGEIVPAIAAFIGARFLSVVDLVRNWLLLRVCDCSDQLKPVIATRRNAVIPLHFCAAAIFAAVACLALIHRTILAGFVAVRFVRCKRDRAQPCDQNRKQDFRVDFHRYNFVRLVQLKPAKNTI
jgi:hypothetical protein